MEKHQIHSVKWPARLLPNFETRATSIIEELTDDNKIFYYNDLHHFVMIYLTIVIGIIVIIYFYRKLELATIP